MVENCKLVHITVQIRHSADTETTVIMNLMTYDKLWWYDICSLSTEYSKHMLVESQLCSTVFYSDLHQHSIINTMLNSHKLNFLHTQNFIKFNNKKLILYTN